MTRRTIITLPDPVLRRKARPIKTFSKDLQTLIDDMIETMREAPGVGLAAPQVGISERLIVVEYGEDTEDENGEIIEGPKKLYVLVNPEITWLSDETITDSEGCLSLASLAVEVPRAAKVKVEGKDLEGNQRLLELEGIEARILQHEIDHLSGVMIHNRTSREQRKDLMGRLRQVKLPGER